jgi:formate transporter
MAQIFGFDCYSPREIAARVEEIGVAKLKLPWLSQFALGVLAGGFIGLGAMCFTLVAADPTLGFALSRVLGGVVFSLGLILVVIAGAELFTGNNLLIMARVSGRVGTRRMLAHLALILFANFIGAAGLALLVAWSGQAGMADGAVGRAMVKIAADKCALPWEQAFCRGVLCNILVCLAVWLALAGHTVTDKILAVVPPVAAFVAAGFEHSVANLYFIPLGMLVNGDAGPAVAGLGWNGLLRNLVPVISGNLAGGAGMVGLVYWVIYRRPSVRE